MPVVANGFENSSLNFESMAGSGEDNLLVLIRLQVLNL